MQWSALFIAFMIYAWSAAHSPQSTLRSPASTKILKGFNIAWWDTHYGHQWNEGSFSPRKVRELLDLAKNSNSDLVRIWLFEDSGMLQFEKDETGMPVALREEYIPNVLYFLKECKKRGLKANLTLFDGNAYPHERLPESQQRGWWWNVLNNKYAMGTWFLKAIVNPLFDAIDEEGLKEVVAQVEIMNEIDAAVKYDIFANDWISAQAFVCQWHNVFKDRKIQYGVSVGHAGAYKHLQNGDLPTYCSDYQDLHLYNDTGEIPGCDWFKKAAANGAIFQLGEYGQKNPRFDDDLQTKVTFSFLNNARECGFQSALAWRLEDVRPGHNREARHSYTAFGETRPAYDTIKQFQAGSN
ncbi:MAG: hypothetical protein K2P81_13435 [Bacteriovoracaceae bacterium]|nr:hypothetical protein [Bacteriovoracaceae bacterium]